MGALAQFLAAVIVGLAEKLAPTIFAYLRERKAEKQQAAADAKFADDLKKIEAAKEANK